MWNESPDQAGCMIQDAWGWCTGMTQRDGMGREVGAGYRMGNTCTPVADSCWYMAKPIQYCKVISLQLKSINLHLKERLDDGTLPFKLCCFHNSSIRISFGSKRICWYKYTTYYLQSLLWAVWFNAPKCFFWVFAQATHPLATWYTWSCYSGIFFFPIAFIAF